MTNLRKALVIGVSAITVFSMSMVAAPVKVEAAASAGDLIKIDGYAPVYYLGADNKRYVFPNESTYFSWYSDFSSVKTLGQTEVESYPLAANVVVRPGTKLVKRPVPTDPKVYAVEPNGVLRHIPTEAVAVSLYGNNWSKRVVDIVDSFFVNYSVAGTGLTAGVYPAGSLVKFGTSADVYYINKAGEAQKIANEAAFLANRFKWDDILTAPATATMPAAGTDITAKTSVADTSQGGNSGTGPVVDPNVGTGLSAALSSATPASVSVPKNGARVPMTKVNLTASNDGKVTVNALVVKRIGLSTYGEVSSVWAEKDGTVVASKKTVNSNDEATLTFVPALVIEPGTTVSLDLLAALNGATGNIGLGISSASAVMTNGANVSGSFPINGNLMAPIDYKVAGLGLSGTSTAALAPKVGDEKAELGKFTVDFNTNAVSGGARDITLQSVMLKNNGVEDLSATAMNLYLEYNGDKVTKSATVNGRFVTFTFVDGFSLLKDDSAKILYIKGDVIGKESTSAGSYVFSLNKSTDLVAFEKSTGFGVNVYNTTTGDVLADAFAISTVNTQSGVITISKKSTSPAATTIVKGTDNTVLIANLRADEDINADGMNIVYGSTSTASTAGQFENVRVYVNGILVDSFDPVSSGNANTAVELNSSLSLKKGDNEIKVMAKAKSTASANAAFYAKLDSNNIFTGENPEYAATGNAVNANEISGSATGATFTVQGAQLTTVRNDGFAAAKVIVKGTSDALVGKFTVKATNDDVKVTSVQLSANASSTPASSINDAKLFVDGTQVGNTVDFGSSGATFSSLNLTIAKDTTKTFELRASFDSSATGGFQTTMTLNAQDSRGTAITSGNSAATTNFMVSEAGTLNVDLGGDTPQDAMLAASSAQQDIAQFKFTAINDAATLGDITIMNTSSATTTIATNEADSEVSGLYLYDGTTLIDTVQLVNGEATFSVADKVIVPANGNKTLTVKALFNEISNNPAATNVDIRLAMGTVEFKSSAGNVTTQTENLIANTFRVRKTIPTVTTQALPETLLTAGDKTVSKFTVTANATGDVTLYKVVLNYATTTNATLLGMASNAVKVNGSTKNIASTLDAAAKTLTVTFATPEVISAGTSKTFEILGTVGVSGQGSESITTKITEDADYATDGNFVWSDGADITTPTKSNGHRVPGLTTATQTLSK